MERFAVKTRRKREVVDVTDRVASLLGQNASGSGVVQLHVLHTTAAVTTADLDSGTDLDYLDAFEVMVPKLNYRHPHNPEHTPDHILSALVGTSASVPFADGRLVLGTWQRLILLEFDGPRSREMVVTLLRESGARA
jgi:secondary thiamine-phosphate synthase enzyme